ncbi:hypothetical protein Cfor_02921 [Coptotermes formosanus]|uniref:HAT C-terminal dimerisation domain-containing protein n=1 Tax=Coptotermes formosanus TaxID=36987 RepID=A0A6L2PTK9_COPFO|nr:hypothetical protein Cfor_02921 [Coptotermes formosanus]
MVRRQEGLVKLMQEATTAGNNFVVQHHCLIYQQYLCAKSLKSESVIRVVNEVNFIRSEGLNHREFQDLLHNLETEFEDVVYYSEVRWLSRGKMLKRVFHLKQEIRTLMEGKGKPVAEFNADEWMCDFAFKVDITTYLNELNTRLQGKDQFMNCLITSSPSKCNYVFGNQLEMESLVHFPILLRCNGRDSQIQAGTTSKLREEFDTRFQDFKNTDLVSMLWSPFSEKYRGIHRDAVFMTSLFGSTYLCEKVFTRMKHVNCTTRLRIMDRHLDSSLRVSTSSITPDIGSLVREKQYQAPH